MGDKKLVQIIAETEKQKERENGAEPIKFFELSITIRAGSIDDIIGLIPRVTGSFMNGDERVGSWCGDDSNYEFNLSEK